MKNKGFGLVSVLISIVIIIVVAAGGFYYSNNTNTIIKDTGGIKKILNKTDSAVKQLEENNKNISNNLNETTGLQLCPDKWFDNQELGEPLKGYQRQYFILNEERYELIEFDMEWVQENCRLEKQILY